MSINGETDIGFPCNTSNMNEVEKHIRFYCEMELKCKEKSCKMTVLAAKLKACNVAWRAIVYIQNEFCKNENAC